MTNKERLDEIAHENLMSGGDKDLGWLIERIRKLEAALEYIANSCPGPEQLFELENKRAAMKALEE